MMPWVECARHSEQLTSSARNSTLAFYMWETFFVLDMSLIISVIPFEVTTHMPVCSARSCTYAFGVLHTQYMQNTMKRSPLYK